MLSNEYSTPLLLRQMLEDCARMPEIYQPSPFWYHLNAVNASQIERYGLDNFKRTINQNYYNWVPANIEDNQIRKLMSYWVSHPSLLPLEVQIEDDSSLYDWPHGTPKPLANREGKELYRFFVGLHWWYVMNNDPFGFLDDLSEPTIGNPIRTTLNGRLISQDIANSVRELTTICEAQPLMVTTPVILELGAGYGRLCYVCVSSLQCRYIIVDIPPALYVAQWYLCAIFPDRRVFTARPFSNFGEVIDDFSRAAICFLTPDQLEMLPDSYADVAVSVSALHEMSVRQIDHYKRLLERKTRSLIYFKQWIRTVLDGAVLTRGNYDLAQPWTAVIDRTDPIQDLFFEAVFRR
jgi:putative sugar O-methyltransferase